LRVQVADNIRLLSFAEPFLTTTLSSVRDTIDAKDLHIAWHSMRVGRYAAGMASSLVMSDAEITGIRAAGQLHDIGKVTVDKSSLQQAFGIASEEFREIADHTIMGHQIVSSVRFPGRRSRKWCVHITNARTAPDTLTTCAWTMSRSRLRIIGVADTFDAMTSERPYRKGLSSLQAAEELVRLAPTKFDFQRRPSLAGAIALEFPGERIAKNGARTQRPADSAR